MKLGENKNKSTPFWRAKKAPFQGTFYLSWMVKYAPGSLADNEAKKQVLYETIFFIRIFTKTQQLDLIQQESSAIFGFILYRSFNGSIASRFIWRNKLEFIMALARTNMRLTRSNDSKSLAKAAEYNHS